MWPLIAIPALAAIIAFSVRRELKQIEADFAEHERTNCAHGAKHGLSERLYPTPTDRLVAVKNTSDERLRAYTAKMEAKAKQEAEERARQEAEWRAFYQKIGAKKVVRTNGKTVEFHA